MATFIPPTDFPYQRACPVAEILGSSNQLAAAWEKSAADLQKLNSHCESNFSVDSLLCICVAGSLGRMESLLVSDIDYIVVVADETSCETRHQVIDSFNEAVVDLGYAPPKIGGVFANAATTEEIVATGEVGKLNESIATYGKRIHLLLEAQPVFGFENHARLIDKILRRWGRAASPETAWWLYLQNDIVRYWRALQIDYQWRHIDSPARHRLRNLKLYHSRLTAIAGLLFVLGAATLQNEPLDYLSAMLRLTSWERVVRLIEQSDSSLAKDFVVAYNSGHAILQDGDFRTARNDDHTLQLKGDSLRESCESLTEFLASFIARRPAWASKEFWNRLIVG